MLCRRYQDSLQLVSQYIHAYLVTLQKLKLLFYHIDTGQPYTEELKYCALKSEARETTEDSLLCVWQSLNKNQKQILRFIAERELSNLNVADQEATHYTLQELLDKCIEEVLLCRCRLCYRVTTNFVKTFWSCSTIR